MILLRKCVVLSSHCKQTENENNQKKLRRSKKTMTFETIVVIWVNDTICDKMFFRLCARLILVQEKKQQIQTDVN